MVAGLALTTGNLIAISATFSTVPTLKIDRSCSIANVIDQNRSRGTVVASSLSHTHQNGANRQAGACVMVVYHRCQPEAVLLRYTEVNLFQQLVVQAHGIT